MKKIKVLSLFDGISCAQVALEALGYDMDYYASEIDPYAIKITQLRYPRTKQLGDVQEVNVLSDGRIAGTDYNQKIDLLIGGSPCQDLSVAKVGREGLAGDRSKLFYEYVRILETINPKYFLLENVASMSKASKDRITEVLGVEPIMIDATLVSAQSRKRLFWTNIPGVDQPADRGILLKDIIEKGFVPNEKARTLTASYTKGPYIGNMGTHRERQIVWDRPIQIGAVAKGMSGRVYSINGKSVTLKAGGGGSGAKTGLYDLNEKKNREALRKYVRPLTPIECERLQSLPDGYTEGVSKTQRIKALGNAFNVEVVKHILSYIK